MPGRFITDRQYEDYMNLRTQHTQHIAAAKAGFSQSTGSRLDRIRDLLLRKNRTAAMAAASLIPWLTSGIRRYFR